MIIIRSNVGTTSDVLIPDLGVVIPSGGGEEEFVTVEEQNAVRESDDLLDLATGDFGNGKAQLILNDGSQDIAQSELGDFLNSSSVFQDYAEEAARDSSNKRLIYVGRAANEGSTTTADAEWQIYRVDLDTTSKVKQYADGDTNFDNVWDNRESLSYS